MIVFSALSASFVVRVHHHKFLKILFISQARRAFRTFRGFNCSLLGMLASGYLGGLHPVSPDVR